MMSVVIEIAAVIEWERGWRRGLRKSIECERGRERQEME
jgi:hypothetical protein